MNYSIKKVENVLQTSTNKLKNRLYEGDNLLLLHHFKNKEERVEVIYIDPPYNTGGAFAYHDSRPLVEWKEMMKKRLELAKEVLTQDGLMFISIDDSHYAHLRLLVEEVFGVKNVLPTFIWEKSYSTRNNNRFSSTNHEYVITVAKDKATLGSFQRLPRTAKNNKQYTKNDNDGRGYYRLDNLSAPNTTYDFSITLEGKSFSPPKGRGWGYSKERIIELYKQGYIYVPEKETSPIQLKRYLNEAKGVVTPTILEHEEAGHMSMGRKELNSMIGKEHSFPFPKPSKLIKRLIRLHPNKKAKVLDFFAGSGTTGQAVLELNKEDGGERTFILCTLNEVSEKTQIEFLQKQGKLLTRNKGEFKNFLKENSDWYNSFLNTEEFKNLGIVYSVTIPRLKALYKGYKLNNKENSVGIKFNLEHLSIYNEVEK